MENIFTTLNGLYPLFRSVKEFINFNIVDGITKDNSFDLLTFRERSTFEVEDDDKLMVYIVMNAITYLLRLCGFLNP